jgi:hypothetical protein
MQIKKNGIKMWGLDGGWNKLTKFIVGFVIMLGMPRFSANNVAELELEKILCTIAKY